MCSSTQPKFVRTFNNYIDHNLVLENMLGANTIPLTILVDANGRVLKKSAWVTEMG
jgi:hypothetical protein